MIMHADLSERVSMVNGKLQEICAKNGLEFINNSNLDSTCLNGSQLHLNDKGNAFLATNFIKLLRGGDVKAHTESSYRSYRDRDFRRNRSAQLNIRQDFLKLLSIRQH